MNSLLKRQIRKFLPLELQSNKDLESFLDAVNKSYQTSDEQFAMLQRSTIISSEELFNANQQLKKESEYQKEVIEKLKKVLETLKFYDLSEDKNIESETMNSSKLVDFIDAQTKKIIKINQQRDKLLESLESQNQELKDYTHMVSHDLKSPLQSIDALTTWLSEDYKNIIGKEGNEKIKLIKGNVEKMDNLVKSVLEYATIAKLDKKLCNVDVHEFLENLIYKKEIPKNTTIHFANKLPVIKADSYRVERLFKNLLSNAIKFNNKEKVTIEIGSLEKEKHWEFYIKDNGKGIEKNHFEKIFSAFQKLENNYKSSGIGLSIVKKIIDVYGGKIWLESELNIGTTFYFTIKK